MDKEFELEKGGIECTNTTREMMTRRRTVQMGLASNLAGEFVSVGEVKSFSNLSKESKRRFICSQK